MADELYRREQFDEAIKEFDRVLERKPGHFWAQYLDALCLLRQHRPAEARALLGACLAQRPDFVWLYLLRGFAHQELQDWAAADSDFQKAAQMPLDDNARYVLLVNRGVLRVRTDRIDDAVADLDAAIKLKPNAYQAFVNLAQAYRRLDKLDLALEQLRSRRRARAGPGPPRPPAGPAPPGTQRAGPRPDRTSTGRSSARTRTAPTGSTTRSNAAGCCCARARTPRRWRHSTRPSPCARTIRRPSACVRRPCSGWAASKRSSRRSIATSRRASRSRSVYRGRGLARAELGQYPGAIEDFTKALELHPTSAVQAYRGWTYLVVDAPKLALRDFELAIELDPKNGDAYCGRGFARAKLGRHREAVAGCRGSPPPRPDVAALALQRRPDLRPVPRPARRRRALELIQQALSLLPDDQPSGLLVHAHPEGCGHGRAPPSSVVHPARIRALRAAIIHERPRANRRDGRIHRNGGGHSGSSTATGWNVASCPSSRRWSWPCPCTSAS